MTEQLRVKITLFDGRVVVDELVDIRNVDEAAERHAQIAGSYGLNYVLDVIDPDSGRTMFNNEVVVNEL